VVLRSQIRTIRPGRRRTAPRSTTNVVRLDGVADEVNIQRMRDQEFRVSAPPAPFFADDMEIFERTQEGLQSGAVEWLVFFPVGSTAKRCATAT